MAKKGPDLVVQAEQAVRDALQRAIGHVPSEWTFVDTALEALELVAEGLKMRQQELESEVNDGEENGSP